MKDFNSIALLLNKASVALSKSLNSTILAHDIDLPHSQFIVLRCLYYNDQISQLDIAKLLSKDAAAIKRTVDELEKKGLVIRKPIRNLKNSICITDNGIQLMPQVLEIAKTVIDKSLIDVEEEAKNILRETLEKIVTNLEN